MPTKYKDYPIYTYDEPAVYSSFIGGINTDPSNEHLLDTEMRDCVNMHFLSGALVKRKGAKKICDISCEDDLETIQGIFLFTNKLSYIIVAADGKLYQGIYNANTTIELTRLYIKNSHYNSIYEYDETDPLSGMYDNIKSISEIQALGKHDGYLQKYIVKNGKEYLINDRTSEEYSECYEINVGDLFTDGEKNYLCIYSFYRDGSNNVTLTNEKFFVAIDDSDFYRYYLIFQNYRKIEAATINNNLYIATGTRIVEVSLMDNNTLKACVVEPYMINNTELIDIGYNYMSPYPELAISTNDDTASTGVKTIKVKKLKEADENGNIFELEPIYNIQSGDSLDNYKFRWEKYIDGKWYVIVPFYAQTGYVNNTNGAYVEDTSINKKYQLMRVKDADKYQYKLTICDSFEMYSSEVADNWSLMKSYDVDDKVTVDAAVYKCLYAHSANSETVYPKGYFSKTAVVNGETVVVWEELHNTELLPMIEEETDTELKIKYIQDYTIDSAGGNPESATSVIWDDDGFGIESTFEVIQSCTKVMADGDKLLFYGDSYNSGEWFKTIIKNPGYITDRGCLSFKTTKNEELVKVVPFQGNIIAFANSSEVGGSIHLIKGNGDDYNSGDGYYSPYQRSTINASVSCSNPDTVQICDNYLVFKYFDRVYYINASDLDNDVIKVTQCNKRVITQNSEVAIPWDDDDCISEVTDTYYGLIWKEKYSLSEDGTLTQIRPGARVKMYYNMSVQYPDSSYGMPWLRDESDVFNSKFIIYIKGKPIYLYNNVLLSFDEEDNYTDIDKSYTCKVHFKGVGLGYDQQYKFIEHAILGFYRNQYKKIDLSVIIKNEAGFTLLDSDSKKFSVNDLPSLKLGMNHSSDTKLKIGSTIQDMKLYNTVNMFPCLLADAVVTADTDSSFTLSSITYQYTSTEQPETNPYDMYGNIIRPKEAQR